MLTDTRVGSGTQVGWDSTYTPRARISLSVPHYKTLKPDTSHTGVSVAPLIILSNTSWSDKVVLILWNEQLVLKLAPISQTWGMSVTVWNA